MPESDRQDRSAENSDPVDGEPLGDLGSRERRARVELLIDARQRVDVVQANLFPEGRAELVVWLDLPLTTKLGRLARQSVGAIRGASARNVEHMLSILPRGKAAA